MNKLNLTLENSRFKVKNSELLIDVPKTYLSGSVSAAGVTLTVENISGGAVSQYMVLGEIGDEKTEIVQNHVDTAPTGSTITLITGGVVYDHPVGTPVYFVGFNQIEFNNATTSGGTKTVLATQDITPDEEYSTYNDTTNTTGYGYVRFKNSTLTTYSQYLNLTYP